MESQAEFSTIQKAWKARVTLAVMRLYKTSSSGKRVLSDISPMGFRVLRLVSHYCTLVD